MLLHVDITAKMGDAVGLEFEKRGIFLFIPYIFGIIGQTECRVGASVTILSRS
jgi:hypothetical protein